MIMTAVVDSHIAFIVIRQFLTGVNNSPTAPAPLVKMRNATAEIAMINVMATAMIPFFIFFLTLFAEILLIIPIHLIININVA